MIGLQVDNELLDMEPGQTLPIEWESALMSDEYVLAGVGTLPFSLPMTEKNRRLCRHFELVEQNTKLVQLDCNLLLGENHWCKGTLTVGVKGDMYDCDFSEVNALAADGEKKLAEVVNGSETIITAFKRWYDYLINPIPGTTARMDIYIDGVQHQFSTVGNPSQAATADALYALIIADTEVMELFDVSRFSDAGFSEEGIYLELKGDNTISKNSNLSIMAGSAFHMSLGSFHYGGYTPWNNFQRDEIVPALKAAIDDVYDTVSRCFPVIKNDDFYGDKNTDYTTNGKVVNNYLLDAYSKNSPITNDRTYAISPQLFLYKILDLLATEYNFRLSGTLAEIEQVFERCFVYNNRALDIDGSDLPDDSGKYNFYKALITYAEHMPDATLKEFLSAIKNVFCSLITYKNDELSIDTCLSLLNSQEITDWTGKNFKNIDELKGCFEDGFTLKYSNDGSDSYLAEHDKEPDIYAGEVATFADLPKKDVEPGSIYRVTDELKLYRAFKTDLNVGNAWVISWQYYSHDLRDYVHTNGVKDLDSGNSPTVNDDLVQEYTVGVFRKIDVPHIYQTGSSREYDLGTNQPPVRLLFYWGGKQGLKKNESNVYESSAHANEKYPFASMDNFDMDGNQLGDYALRWEGEWGLYEKFHKDWLAFRNQARKVTLQVVIPVGELLQLDLRKKVRINQNLFFIDRIKTDLGKDTEEAICTVDLYTL